MLKKSCQAAKSSYREFQQEFKALPSFFSTDFKISYRSSWLTYKLAAEMLTHFKSGTSSEFAEVESLKFDLVEIDKGYESVNKMFIEQVNRVKTTL